jgi:hypothetical protein
MLTGDRRFLAEEGAIYESVANGGAGCVEGV